MISWPIATLRVFELPHKGMSHTVTAGKAADRPTCPVGPPPDMADEDASVWYSGVVEAAGRVRPEFTTLTSVLAAIRIAIAGNRRRLAHLSQDRWRRTSRTCLYRSRRNLLYRANRCTWDLGNGESRRCCICIRIRNRHLHRRGRTFKPRRFQAIEVGGELSASQQPGDKQQSKESEDRTSHISSPSVTTHQNFNRSCCRQRAAFGWLPPRLCKPPLVTRLQLGANSSNAASRWVADSKRA